MALAIAGTGVVACASGPNGGSGGTSARTGGARATAGAPGTGGASTGGAATGGRAAGGAGGSATAGASVGGKGGAGGTVPPTGPCTLPPAATPLAADLQPAGPAVAATATRPQLSQAAADDRETSAKVLAAAGTVASSYTSNGAAVTSVDALVVDGWDPVSAPVGDVAGFTPMYTVAADGTGQFVSIQAAINAARSVTATACARVYVAVRPGTYREVVTLPNKTGAAPLTLYGTDPDARKTVILFGNASLTVASGATSPLGTSGSATFTQNSSDFQAKNLTFANDYQETGSGNEQAVALLNQGDRSAFENVRVLGNQDSLYLKTANPGTVGRVYFRDSYVEGDTDFIFGRATAVFDHCEIHTVGTNKVMGTAAAAPSTELTNPYGFLFISSRFTADANVAAGGTYFARQWYESSRPQAVGKMIVRNSTVGPHIVAAAPWQPWAGRTIPAPLAGPDAGAGGAAGDGGVGATTAPVNTPLYTSDAFYALTGGGPSPPEIYIAEYGNTTAN